MSKQDELSEVVRELEACTLCRERGIGKVVPGEGSPYAEIVFVGEAPGKEEAKTGRPFVGRSGKLLRSMIKSIGLDEEDIYITNPVKYLPKRGTPATDNIVHGRTHLFKELSVIDPQIVALLGSIACRAVLDNVVSVTREHGTTVQKDGRTYFITFHPSAALRFSGTREKFADDFRKLGELVQKEARK